MTTGATSHVHIHATSAPPLTATLDRAAANALLEAGGYGLRIEPRLSGYALTGPGTGTGVPLPRPLPAAALYRALVRLRARRSVYDPGWLHDQARELANGTGTETPRPLARGHAHDELTDGTGTGTAPRLARSEAHDELAGGSEVEAPRRLARGQAQDELAGGTGAEGSRRLARGQAQDELIRRLRSNSTVENDPVLRMHCATQPARVGVGDPRTGMTRLVKAVAPHPPHPAHPGGTFPVSVAALTADGGALLRQIVELRRERPTDPLGYFLDRFVRPPVRILRVLLDRYQLCLLDDEHFEFSYELSPEYAATGRIVVPGFGALPTEPAHRQRVARAGLCALYQCLRSLATAFDSSSAEREDSPPPERSGSPAAGLNGAEAAGRSGSVAAGFGSEEVWAAVERVVAEELRFLQPPTAALLGRHELLHAVPPGQEQTLRAVLKRVEDAAHARRSDPSLPRPAVMIDLDHCGFVPLRRTLSATALVAGARPGAPGGIPELAEPSLLVPLPNHHPPAWEAFLDGNGLRARYPDVDWATVRAEYERAFHRPWENQRDDLAADGLARFAWDVRDAGGEVVFNTGRRERLRGYTTDVLARHGITGARLLMLPDDRTRPVAELKVENLRALPDLDVVAVFDDLAENRVALQAAFPGATMVAVEPPGFAMERLPGAETEDGAAVVATFEHRPAERAKTTLSHARSVEELQLAEMSTATVAGEHAVHLDRPESLALVSQLVARADEAAERTARNAHRQHRGALAVTSVERTAHLFHHVLTRKQFNKGARTNYTARHALRDIARHVRRGEPIPLTLLGFPVKQAQSGLKATGPLPDLAELAGLVRLHELQRTVEHVYPPGVRILILTDGQHFRPRPAALVDAYARKAAEYLELVGAADFVVARDIDDVATDRFGPDLPERRARLVDGYRRRLAEALAGLDVTHDPLGTLALADARYRAGAGPGKAGFADLFMSIVHSVRVDVPTGRDRAGWSREVYADLYSLRDPATPPEVTAGREQVLTTAWDETVRYVCSTLTDDALGYHRLSSGIRLRAGASTPGSPGFSYLGGSALLPWHGTGAVDGRGHVAVDFAVSLLDQGFVPVHSPLMGTTQPWFMVPVTRTRVLDRQRGAELDPEYVATIRLRPR